MLAQPIALAEQYSRAVASVGHDLYFDVVRSNYYELATVPRMLHLLRTDPGRVRASVPESIR